ncbi:hypothetical protein RJZ56_000145 [Blastomyces dermatitidis]|uniref:Serine hydrolase domain-containing protein n=1 Tax=Blastomyces gilchristii (strain SLH14081) TaxID=559298 RepID=A0A179UWF3_BLAGS|nr:uncharacterized protein BDBG_07529 [Blastomyces gilchristii SLH14081]OAT12143.1 hypothetical protein BDBG_07529 [Blastomyces gilchristii SLH14081]
MANCPRYPLEITSLVTSKEDTFAHYNPNSPEIILKALDNLGKYIEDEGPFDGVIGFSQGAMLATSYGIHKYQEDPGQEDTYLQNFDAIILELRRSPYVVTYKHSGGHEVPSSTSMEALAETVKMIKRAINMARKQHVTSI